LSELISIKDQQDQRPHQHLDGVLLINLVDF
jgi:hypothetical protein